MKNIKRKIGFLVVFSFLFNIMLPFHAFASSDDNDSFFSNNNNDELISPGVSGWGNNDSLINSNSSYSNDSISVMDGSTEEEVAELFLNREDAILPLLYTLVFVSGAQLAARTSILSQVIFKSHATQQAVARGITTLRMQNTIDTGIKYTSATHKANGEAYRAIYNGQANVTAIFDKINGQWQCVTTYADKPAAAYKPAFWEW